MERINTSTLKKLSASNFAGLPEMFVADMTDDIVSVEVHENGLRVAQNAEHSLRDFAMATFNKFAQYAHESALQSATIVIKTPTKNFLWAFYNWDKDGQIVRFCDKEINQ